MDAKTSNVKKFSLQYPVTITTSLGGDTKNMYVIQDIESSSSPLYKYDLTKGVNLFIINSTDIKKTLEVYDGTIKHTDNADYAIRLEDLSWIDLRFNYKTGVLAVYSIGINKRGMRETQDDANVLKSDVCTALFAVNLNEIKAAYLIIKDKRLFLQII